MPPCGRERVGQHVGAVGVGAPVVLRPGLALGVGLHQEAAEVGDERVDLVGLALPPGGHLRVERIGGRQAADLDRRAEARGQVDADAVGPEDVGERRRLARGTRAVRLVALALTLVSTVPLMPIEALARA